MRRLYHFLGGIRFAIILITTAALFVITGTFLESKTGSHRYAASWVYSSLLFTALLWLFFVNILISALRRWPFQKRHIPFLITHFGLLMILAGCLCKSYFGIQGSMGIMEGSGSHTLFLPNTYAIRVEDRAFNAHQYPLKNSFAELLEFSPHSIEQMETWIKGDHAYVRGLDPFPVQANAEGVQARLHHPKSDPWHFLALHAADVSEAAQKIFLQGLQVRFTDRLTQTILFEGPFIDAPETTLEFAHSPIEGFTKPAVFAEINDEQIRIPLSGTNSLINVNLSTPHQGTTSIAVDFIRQPTIAFIQDLEGDVHLFAFDAHGQVHSQTFRSHNLDSLVVYDQGFGGYAVQSTIPFYAYPSGRHEKESAQLYQLATDLRHGIETEKHPLAPPLELLRKASDQAGVDFVDTCVHFLTQWDQQHRWLYPRNAPIPEALAHVISSIDWTSIPANERKACFWTSVLLSEIEQQVADGRDFIQLLKERNWPLIESLEQIRTESGRCHPEELPTLFTTLSQQIFTVSDQLPDPEPTPLDAHLLSAYFQLYSIHLHNVLPPPDQESLRMYHAHRLYALAQEKSLSQSELLKHEADLRAEPVTIETPLTMRYRNAKPSNKMEDLLPKITLAVSDKDKKEVISLSYDRFGTGLKWPVLNGKYLVRFQPKFHEIPYHIRLRRARQINYANSSQPFSYEADLIIEDRTHGSYLEKTISMNHVHETWEGYRFYLASIAPAQEGAVKRVQIVVNYDPAKYLLTYPGAVILSLGILLLFWLKPRR